MKNPELNKQSASSIDSPISSSDTVLNSISINNVIRRNIQKAVNILYDKDYDVNYFYDFSFTDGGLQIIFSSGILPISFSSIPSPFIPFILQNGRSGFYIERTGIGISYEVLIAASTSLLNWAIKLPSAVVYYFEVDIPMGKDTEEFLECFKDSFLIYNFDLDDEDENYMFFSGDLILATDVVSVFEAKLKKFANENGTTVFGLRVD